MGLVISLFGHIDCSICETSNYSDRSVQIVLPDQFTPVTFDTVILLALARLVRCALLLSSKPSWVCRRLILPETLPRPNFLLSTRKTLRNPNRHGSKGCKILTSKE
jgi:hypothetical protein